MYVHIIQDQSDDIINNNACRRQVIMWKLKSAVLVVIVTCQASWAILWALLLLWAEPTYFNHMNNAEKPEWDLSRDVYATITSHMVVSPCERYLGNEIEIM